MREMLGRAHLSLGGGKVTRNGREDNWSEDNWSEEGSGGDRSEGDENEGDGSEGDGRGVRREGDLARRREGKVTG